MKFLSRIEMAEFAKMTPEQQAGVIDAVLEAAAEYFGADEGNALLSAANQLQSAPAVSS